MSTLSEGHTDSQVAPNTPPVARCQQVGARQLPKLSSETIYEVPADGSWDRPLSLDELLQTMNSSFNYTALLQLKLAAQRRTDEEELKRIIYLVSVPVMLFFCTVATIINLTICLSSRLIRRPLSPTMCFSVSLAGADAFAASILGLGLLVNSLLPVGFGVETLNVCFSLAFEALRLGGVISTAAHLLALALNHYVGILRPLHYARLITRGRVLTCIVLLWLVPIAFFFLYFLAAGGFRPAGECSFVFLHYSTFRRVVASLFFVPLGCMFFTYSHIFVIIRQHQKGILRYQNSSQLKSSVKAIVTTLLILGTYILGWMPGLLTYILICADCAFHARDLGLQAQLGMTITANTLIVLKCLVDPVIYAARMPEIKMALPTTLPSQRGAPLRSQSCTAAHNATLRINGNAMIPLRALRGAPQPAEC
ncbi:melanocyte-stimulating hormone receptor-like [Pollicipes pollicipes]|uniref:melanocyte-stimulating hormone receptor-like n=1 Tax=Pollicipes pollicipes TaxID=41117 RepID=UPI001884C043|nr:melanocyte-stimulating hormone receptor-like [Pollicipes pollicipes]